MDTQTPASPPRELPRKLGLLDSTNIVVGTMIGSAIFLVPNTIAQNIHSVSLTLAMWVVAGIVSMFGALAYAELGAMMPDSGGQYVYLREAWGPLWGFLCGWMFFLVARSGGTAAAAAGFATYFSQFVPMSVAASRGLAAALILVLTLVNWAITASRSGPGLSASQFGSAMVVCLFSYNGWFALGMMGGEIKDPRRNLPRAIILGVALVMLVYILANIGYLRTLTISEIAGTERVAEATAARTMGTIGSTFVALTILVSILGTTNSTIMSVSRLYFAQARDGLFSRPFGTIHPAFETPHVALLGSGIWSAILAFTGSYSQLVSYAIFTFWIFYGMTVAGLLVLRRTRPDVLRPYRMFGYPITPVLFIGVAGGVAIFAFISAPLTSTIGLSILAAGVPAYYAWRQLAKRKLK